MAREKKQKEEVVKQPYTKGTLAVQIVMTICAIIYLAPIFIIIN